MPFERVLSRLAATKAAGEFDRYAFAGFFTVAGLLHFTWTDFYVNKLPALLPLRRPAVLAAGALEVLCALLSMVPECRRAASWSIALFLTIVLGVNVSYLLGANLSAGWTAILWLRVAALALLSGWAYLHGTYDSVQR